MGCPRTGTTLVSQILDAHSRIAVCHETHFYGIFRPELRRYGDLRRRSSLDHLINDFREVISTQGVAQPPSIEQIHDELAEPTFQGVLTAFLQAHARRQGKARGGDKTPGHYRYLPEILDRHASSPVIFLLRDPRDVVLSIYKAFGGSIKTSNLMWNSALSSYEGVSRPVHLVRYEDLVQKPAETVLLVTSKSGTLLLRRDQGEMAVL